MTATSSTIAVNAADEGTSQAPDFIVIGAQKSASTFVQTCLQDHPDLFLPDGETPYFEDPDYQDEGSPPWHAIFGGLTKGQLRGIKRPNYIGKTEVPSRIARDLPNAKLIAVLRNPVDRIVAAYFHQMKYGMLPIKPLEQGLSDVLDGGEVLQNWPRSKELVAFGLYAQHLTAYRPFFESGQMLVLLHDDISADALGEIRKCYKFLAVDDGFAPPSLTKRPQKVVYSLFRLRVLRLRNRFMHRYNADRTRLDAKSMSPPEWIVAAVITGLDRYVLARIVKAEKPRVSETLRARLADLYRQDVLELERLIGRDLSAWLEPKG